MESKKQGGKLDLETSQHIISLNKTNENNLAKNAGKNTARKMKTKVQSKKGGYEIDSVDVFDQVKSAKKRRSKKSSGTAKKSKGSKGSKRSKRSKKSKK